MSSIPFRPVTPKIGHPFALASQAVCEQIHRAVRLMICQAIFRRRTPRDGQHGRLERATGRACPMHCERKHAFRGLGRKERDPYSRPASIRLTAPHRADYGNGGASASLGSINVRLALLTVTRSKRWPTRSKPWAHHIFSVPLDRRTQFSSTSRVTAARCESTRLVQQGEGE